MFLHSRDLLPIWETAAENLSKIWPKEKLRLAIVEADHGSPGGRLGRLYHVRKYSGLEIFGVRNRKH